MLCCAVLSRLVLSCTVPYPERDSVLSTELSACISLKVCRQQGAWSIAARHSMANLHDTAAMFGVL